MQGIISEERYIAEKVYTDFSRQGIQLDGEYTKAYRAAVKAVIEIGARRRLDLNALLYCLDKTIELNAGQKKKAATLECGSRQGNKKTYYAIIIAQKQK